MDPIRVYNLGDKGVVVDPSPIHTQDGTWAKTQNAIRDPLGLDHGLHKRPGLVKFTATAAAGSVLGGIGVPLVLLATAINGVTLPGAGGNTPSLTGPAPGQGGGNSTGSGIAGGGGGGAVASGTGNTGGGSSPTTGKRVLYWARSTTNADLSTSQGWNRFEGCLPTGVLPNATAILAGSPANARAGSGVSLLTDSTLSGLLTGAPGCAVVSNNKLYYVSSNFTSGTDAIPIRVWDGATDSPFVSIPVSQNEGATVIKAWKIGSMMVNAGILYLTVFTGANVSQPYGGRVFQITLSTGAILQVGDYFTVSNLQTPYALAWHSGQLWVGSINFNGAGVGKVYRIHPQVDLTWTLDHSATTGTGVSAMFSYNGELYIGTHASATPKVEKRDTLGAWTTVLSTSFSGNSGSFLSAAEFNTTPTTRDLFFACWYPTASTTTASVVVHQCNAAGTWTPTYSKAHGTGAAAACCTMFVENQCIYVGGGGYGGASVGLDGFLISSVDGTTWLDQSAHLAGTFNTIAVFGVLTEQV